MPPKTRIYASDPPNYAERWAKDAREKNSPRLCPQQTEHRRKLLSCGFKPAFGSWIDGEYREVFATKTGQMLLVRWCADTWRM